MTGKKAVSSGRAGKGGGPPSHPNDIRQGELWDEPALGAPGSHDNAGDGGRPTAGNDGVGAGAPSADRGPERADTAESEEPAPDAIMSAARHLVALLEEGGRQAQGPPAEAPDENCVSVEGSGNDDAEGRARPGEPASAPAGAGEKTSVRAEGGTPERPGNRAGEAIDALRTFRADFGRWVDGQRRSRRRWAAIAMAAGFPAMLLLGLLVERQFQVIPLHDPTNGWGAHIWEMHGRTIVDCTIEAMRTDTEVNCPLVVRRP